MIEVLMQVRKDKYKDNPILSERLDLVEEEEQITHEIQLEEDLKVEEGLSMYPFCHPALFLNGLRAAIFKFDPNYLGNEEKYGLTSLGKAHPMMSQDQRRVIARVMKKVCLEGSYLTSFPIDVSFSHSFKGGY